MAIEIKIALTARRQMLQTTIIVPTVHRLNHVQNLWQNLQDCDVSTISREIIFIINGEDEKTKAFLQACHSPIILQCKQNTPGFARNLALERATGEWILFLDDDIQLPQHYFSRARQSLAAWNPDVLGGPELPMPQSSPLQRAYGFCQGHPLVTGHTYRRHRPVAGDPRADEYSLILCHLWVRGDLFRQGLRFPTNYQRNEENVLLYHLQQAQKKLCHDPQLAVYHCKKTTLLKIIDATFISGRCRMQSFIDYPSSFHPLFLVPTGLILSLCSLPLVSWPPWILLHALYPLLLGYLVLVAGMSSRRLGVALWTAILAPTIHLSYGGGIIWGCFGQKRRR